MIRTESRARRAASLLEMLLAVFIASTCVAGLYVMFVTGARSADRSERAYQASMLAQELIDEARALSADDLNRMIGTAQITPVGHILEGLNRQGRIEPAAADDLLTDPAFQYPAAYGRFTLRRTVSTQKAGLTGSETLYRIVVEVEWTEEGQGGKTGPSRGRYAALVAPGVL